MSMDSPPPAPPPPPSGYGSSGGAAAPPANPLVGYWKRVVLERYAQFQGRARRAEFWWFVLANIIISVVLFALTAIAGVFVVLYVIFWLGMIVPSLAVGVRRLHDTGKSGWFLLLDLIPLVGPIILLVFFATDGTPGTNQYGMSEKYPN
jgi:uncharacterized membrane protein YhaH (DUF805 family)